MCLQAKREIYNVKQQRLAIAQEEVQHLADTLAHFKSSRTSLASVTSGKQSQNICFIFCLGFKKV